MRARRKPSARVIAALRRITADPKPWTGPVERRQPATSARRTKRAAATAAARDAFLAAHVGLIHHVARQLERYLSDEVEYDELVSAGALGLLAAERTFDPSRGLKFSTFAVPRIRGAMLDDLRRQDIASRSTRKRARILDAVRARLGNHLGRAPTREEIAGVLGLPPAIIGRWELAVNAARHVSIEEIVHREEERVGRPLDGVMAVDDSLETRFALAQDREVLMRALQRLPEAQREVLQRYFWLGEQLHEIAAEMQLTESRISQIKSAAIKNLRTHFAVAA